MVRKVFECISEGQVYSAPEVGLFSVNAESVICVSGKGNPLPDADEEDWGEF